MEHDIIIMEKSDLVSWDQIHDILWAAHQHNREQGLKMRKPSLSGSEIEKEIGEQGRLLVAMDGDRPVGTAALLPKNQNTWYNKGEYGYLCFAAVMPEYNGRGVYRKLVAAREEIAVKMGLKVLCFDTHEKNAHVMEINKKHGFIPVSMKTSNDHFNIVMARWMDGCPHSSMSCKMHFLKSFLASKGRYRFDDGKGLVKRFFI